MFKRGVALFVSCAMSSVAFAGATIVLVPNPSGPTYSAGDSITVDVWLSQDPGSDIALRMVQFDVSDTEINEAETEGLFIGFSPLHCEVGVGTGVRFWDFSSTVVSQANPINCGSNHYIDFTRSDSRPCCPEILAIAYGSATALGENLDEQFILPGTGDSIRVGTLNVTILPDTPDGTYTLDVINADNDNQVDPDLGAQVRWGFGTNIAPGNNPLTNWRPGSGLSGGTLDLVVSDAPPCFAASADKPGCDGVIPRNAGTVVKLQYAGDPTAAIDSIQIRELLPDGMFGPNLAEGFTKSDLGGDLIKLTDDGAALANRTWYGITDVCGTKIDYIVIVGDVNGNGVTNAIDANAIWQNRLNPVLDNTPYDINGNGDVTAIDVNAAWQNRDALVDPVPDKPTGHTCPN